VIAADHRSCSKWPERQQRAHAIVANPHKAACNEQEGYGDGATPIRIAVTGALLATISGTGRLSPEGWRHSENLPPDSPASMSILEEATNSTEIQ